MRLAKPTRTLLQMTILGAFAIGAAAQDNPNILPSRVRDQLNQPASSGAQQSPATPKPAAAKAPAQTKTVPPSKAAPAPAPAKAAKVPAKAPASSAAKAPAKPADKAASNGPAKPGAAAPTNEKAAVSRRDPFDSLLTKARPGNGAPENLPPGKAGLMVGTVQITGIIHSANGMIAIVLNPQQRVYFLREGDKLFDGSVDHITLEAVSFHEIGKDAFGKPIERQVTKRLYPTPGEEQ
jgi:hypothetical protein